MINHEAFEQRARCGACVTLGSHHTQWGSGCSLQLLDEANDKARNREEVKVRASLSRGGRESDRSWDLRGARAEASKHFSSLNGHGSELTYSFWSPLRERSRYPQTQDSLKTARGSGQCSVSDSLCGLRRAASRLQAQVPYL